MKSSRTMIIEAMMAILLFAGCGGGTETTSESETTATTSTTGQEQDRIEPITWALADGGTLSAAPGGTINVRVRVKIAEGVRLYTDREYGGLEFAPVPTTAVLQPQSIYGSTGDMVADEGSIRKVDPHFGKQELEYWVGTVTVNIPITLSEEAVPGRTYDASLLINYMSCTDKVCNPPSDAKVPVTIRVVSR